MKKIYQSIYIGLSMLVLNSCSDFLDTVPDTRADIKTKEQIASLLVSGYTKGYPATLWEASSDNLTDNGPRYRTNKLMEQTYRWENVEDESQDSPYYVWTSGFNAIATANQALAYIHQLGDPKEMNPQKGEALLIRAFHYFVLANTFCMPYHPDHASTDLGLPYITQPETKVKVHYERGTLQQTYEQIEKDILEGLPLINDNAYKVPKYRFNKQAAYAFAARFYLYYVKKDKSNYPKVIDYATQALGTSPTLRNYYSALVNVQDAVQAADRYISVDEPANLMLNVSISNNYMYFGVWQAYTRYDMSRSLAENETIMAAAPWGEAQSSAFYNAARGSEQSIVIYKQDRYFEFADRVAQTGYSNTIFPLFTTNELMLERAEAYAMQATPDYDKALADINLWVNNALMPGARANLRIEDLNLFYLMMQATPEKPTSMSQVTQKKQLHPVNAFVNTTQENVIHTILQCRRLETIHEGLRWQDIRRYDMPVTHFHADGPIYLGERDARKAIQIPSSVTKVGFTPNPRNK